jgi:hypothetical protein
MLIEIFLDIGGRRHQSLYIIAYVFCQAISLTDGTF